jgi:hypothetical protein
VDTADHHYKRNNKKPSEKDKSISARETRLTKGWEYDSGVLNCEKQLLNTLSLPAVRTRLRMQYLLQTVPSPNTYKMKSAVCLFDRGEFPHFSIPGV